MGKLYFVDTSIWDDIRDLDLLHDERTVYFFLRHPIEPTLTGLDEQKLSRIMYYCEIGDKHRLSTIIDTLAFKLDNRGLNIITHDSGLFFVPSACYESRRSAGHNFYNCLRRANEMYKGTYGPNNKAFAAWKEYWKDEFYQLQELDQSKKQGPNKPPGDTLPNPGDTLPNPGDTLPNPGDTLPNPGDTLPETIPKNGHLVNSAQFERSL